MKHVALLGTGTMGAGMAGRLVGAGHPLAVWNRHPARAAGLVERGARLADSPADAVQDADAVIAMVADDAASRAVWLGEGGALAAMKPGAVLIDSSTISPGWVAELSAAAKARGCDVLDAPVTGSRVQAASGELSFLVGGDIAVLDRVRDILGVMSKAIVHLGPTGSGAFVKLVNNFVCGVQTVALAEALALIEKSGLDREQALNVLLNGAPGSPLVKGVAQRMLSSDQTLNFSVALMAKDLSYAIREGQRLGIALDTATAARGSFQRAADQGLGGRDIAAVIEPLRS